ncbi:transposase [Pseudoalteromonas prydzensis]|uniref:Transposase n=1 Tax=Pseudoalteromonas prydzensis TaxID=182141 RepID=A0ABR9FNQ8_9GAMM|nr:transposase [Pseudoalteromonas prydzensis]
MKKATPSYTVSELCRALEVSTSSYYYAPVAPNKSEQALLELIKSIADDSGYTYGRRRVNVELNALNHTIGIYKTAALMKKLNIKAIRPKKKHYYPNSGDEHKYAQNLLKREFNPDSHNTHWVGDITYSVLGVQH